MAQSLSDLIVHIVFSTKERIPKIYPETEKPLYAYINGLCMKLNSPLIDINGMDDHVHLLLCMDRSIAASELVGKIKSGSTNWLKRQHENYNDFSWQKGYGIFSVSRVNVENAVCYVQNQKEHHKKVSFKEEYLKILKKNNIKFDERYIWD